MSQATPLYSDYHFILNCYTPQAIDAIIKNIQLHIEGYDFLYVIDTYDIVENYLPYTQLSLFSSNDRTAQAQKFICYDFFFGGINKTKAILMNEYQVELFAAKNKLNKHLRDASVAIRNLDTLKVQTDNFLNDPQKTAAFVRDHFEVVLLLLILNDKSQNIFDEFYTFIRDRLNTTEIQVGKHADQEKINAIFEHCKSSSRSIDIFKAYISYQSRHLSSITDADERHIFLENTFRDIKAIERVLQINQEITNNNLKQKVIYLSSAKKTVEIFKLIQHFKINQDKSIHQNIYQYFLFDRLKNEFRAEPQKALEILLELKELLQKVGSVSLIPNNKKYQEENKQLLALVKRLFDERSSVLDNHFYISIYDRYKTTFTNFLNPKVNTPINGQELQEIVKKVDENRKSNLEKISTLDLALSQLNQTYDIVDTFRGIDNFDPDYRSGKDIIKNPYQHLPILLLIKDDFNSSLKDKLYLFLNTNVEVSESDKPKLKLYIRDIVSELSSMVADNARIKFLKSIVITYLNFVAQSKSERQYHQMEDNIIIDLEKHYEIIKIQFRKTDLEATQRENKMKYRYDDDGLLTEVVYLLTWLYRRALREDEGIKKATVHIHDFQGDARLYQGIGLCYVSKSFRLLLDKPDNYQQIAKDNIEVAIKYLRMAQEQFKQLINDTIRNEISLLVIKNYIAILNSLADMYVRRHVLSHTREDNSLIIIARSLIDEVKLLFNSINLIFDEHPIYLGTELEIEFYEAEYLYYINQISSAHHKIHKVCQSYAKIRDGLLEIRPKEEFMLSGEEIDQLMEKIVKQKLIKK